MVIDAIAAGGDGIGRVEGLAVFVPRTAPGDVAEVRFRLRGRLARGEVIRLHTRSPVRVEPACPHYERDDCGGCQVQHLAYEAQLEAKGKIVRDAFSRIARREVDVGPVVPSPGPWRYRSRLTLAMRHREGRWTLGLHSRLDVNRVFELHTCPITDDRIVEAWAEVGRAAEDLPAASELRGTIRLRGAELAFVLEGGISWPRARSFATRCPSLSVIRWKTARGETKVIADNAVVPAVESFDQVNQEVAVLARNELVQRALAARPAHVIDAYAGTGETASRIADAGPQVTAIEVDPAAVSEVAKRLRSPSRVVTGRVEDHLAAALPADVVIVNPPRAGLDASVTAILDSSVRPGKLLYMSCDPATLARDIQRLPGYRVTSVQPYDMFPQTAHVEVVTELVPEVA
jgi:23S rRNA (uracil1939-C5)-methyltransferase